MPVFLQAAAQLIDITLHTTDTNAEQARLFRSAVVAGGALPALLSLLRSSELQQQFMGARAFHALAIDDPTTDDDNFQSEEICKQGAIPLLVKALNSDEVQRQHRLIHKVGGSGWRGWVGWR